MLKLHLKRFGLALKSRNFLTSHLKQLGVSLWGYFSTVSYSMLKITLIIFFFFFLIFFKYGFLCWLWSKSFVKKEIPRGQIINIYSKPLTRRIILHLQWFYFCHSLFFLAPKNFRSFCPLHHCSLKPALSFLHCISTILWIRWGCTLHPLLLLLLWFLGPLKQLLKM